MELDTSEFGSLPIQKIDTASTHYTGDEVPVAIFEDSEGNECFVLADENIVSFAGGDELEVELHLTDDMMWDFVRDILDAEDWTLALAEEFVYEAIVESMRQESE